MAEVTTTENNELQTAPKRTMVTDFSKGIFGTSDNFLMATQMGKAFASSTIVPKEFQGNLGNCLIALDVANRFKGMSPLTVMQNMYIVYGRPSWSSKFLIAMINNSGKFDQPLKFREEEKDRKPYACTAWTTLNGEVIEGMKVTMDIAKAEGWIDKNGSKWKTMPQLMLRYRAASFFSSLNCPEVTMGLYTAEEIIDGDYKEYSITESVEEAVSEAQEAAEDNTASIHVDIPLEAATKEANEPTEANETTPEKPAKTVAKKEEPKSEEQLDAGF